MHYLATLEGGPERSSAREGTERTLLDRIDGVSRRAKECGIELHGAYPTPSGDAICLVLEADGFEDVTEFLGSPPGRDRDERDASAPSFAGDRDPLLGN